jgi:lariat debranching enzyme
MAGGGRRESAMSSPRNEFVFAVVGDVHGEMHAMVRRLAAWEKRARRALAFVLQVGDFEPHRDAEDLATMAAPAKYKVLGDFPDYVAGRAAFPWPVYFIGGNHEPYGFLDAEPDGFELVANCRYLGRVGVVEPHGLRVAGLSGIYRDEAFGVIRPPVASLGAVSNKAFAYFNERDVERALDLERADVLLLHDWPADVVDPADAAAFEQQRRSMRYDAVGNEYARLLVDGLRPRLVACGHLHKAYRAVVRHATGEVTRVCCLANVAQGGASVAVFRAADGAIEEIAMEPG